MKKAILPLITAAVLSACAADKPMVGGDRDTHDCIGSAGYSWSALKQKCVRPWEVADIKLNDPANNTLAVYVILSADKSQAELAAAGVPENTILDAVKGGYASKDGKTRLLNTSQGWQLKTAP